MVKLDVGLGDRSYEILIADGLLGSAGELIEERLGKRRTVVLTDSNVWSTWGEELGKSLEKRGFDFFTIVLEPGEATKSMSRLDNLLEQMAEVGITRSGLLIAFGGGVIGDLGGFAASIYMRGIDYVQIPTTLLAQVDSAVGGKTAVNLNHGKNLAGTFWQPRLVLSDTRALGTLPEREFAGGMAEVIKYGVIRSKALFEMIEKYPSKAEIMPFMSDIILECCDIKKKVVQNDERDTGERMILNLGHTFGHAIEKIGNYEKYIHGEAVAMGMVIAAKYGETLNLTPEGASERIFNICQKFGLPVEDRVDLNEIAPLLTLDKKAGEGDINIILIKEIGNSFIYGTKTQELSQNLAALESK